MSILFLLASLGVVNGMLLGFCLVIKTKNTIIDRYFGLLLLALSIRIGKSVFFYFDREVDLLILQIGLSACVFIGPFFYLYSRALQQHEQDFKRKDGLLLLGLLVAIVGIGLRFPYRSFPEIWNGYIIYGVYAIWILFTLLGLYFSGKMLRGVIFSPKKMTGRQQYVAATTVAMLFITCTYQAALFVGVTYIWGALIFSFTFYYLLGRALLTKRSVTPKAPAQLLENGTELLKRVNDLMERQKPFVNQRLKLDELAVLADMSRHTLSRVLNEVYKHGFSHYIKEHRVNEAKQLIATRPDLSLEGIGYEAGFNSKSAFFEAFKKIANCTPAEYKRSR